MREIDVNHVAPILSGLVNEIAETGIESFSPRFGHGFRPSLW
ncbi:hypothetical protein [Rhodococcus sp. USK10]|nr:hypothetical protein [Rhodococcus sp. USK10]